MKSNMNLTNTLSVLSEMKTEKVTAQVLEYEDLKGSSDLRTAYMLSYMRNANIKLRQLRLVIHDAGVYVENGALSYMRGPIEISSNTGGVVGLAKKFISSTLSGEQVIKPLLKGTGEILLEPSFNHYLVLDLEDEEIIVDNKSFFAAEETVEISASSVKTLSSALFGNEGLFQTKLKGTGLVVLELPVPETEIIKYDLKNDTLKVDGNFAVLRSGEIEFTVERTTSSLTGSMISGEGLLNVYRGTGEVWLMQTKQIYDELNKAQVSPVALKENVVDKNNLKVQDDH